MRKTLLTLGATAATAATVLALAPAKPVATPAAPDGPGRDQAAAKSQFTDGDEGQGYYYEEIALTPANDKEAHVPIWFTLSIGGAEAAGFFRE